MLEVWLILCPAEKQLAMAGEVHLKAIIATEWETIDFLVLGCTDFAFAKLEVQS